MSRKGIPSSSNILQFWNNRLKEIWSHREDRKRRLQRSLPGKRTQRPHLRTVDPTPNPLVGRARWGHTQGQALHPGEDTWGRGAKTQALGRSGSGSVVCTPQASRGHLGNVQGRRGKATLDPAEGRGRRQRTLKGVGRARKRKGGSTPFGVMLHCTHIIHTLMCLFQTSHQHNSPSLPPPAKEAVPRLKDRPVPRTKTLDKAGTILCIQLPLSFVRNILVCPKASCKGFSSPKLTNKFYR